MTATERIQKIKVLLGLEAPAPAPVEPAPAPVEAPAKLSYKLADGTEIEVSALELGGLVTVAGQPAPAGEHMLDDGTKIVVDTAGVITEVVFGTPAPAPSTPEEMSVLMQKFATGTPEDRLANLEIIAKALFENSFGWELRDSTQKAIRDQAMNVYKTSFDAQTIEINQLKKANEDLLEIVEKMAAAPTADPAAEPVQKFKTEVPETQAEKFEGLKKAIKNLKNK